MMSLIFGQHGRSWGIGEIATAIIVCLAIIGIVIIISKVMGFVIPQWVWQILMIVVAAVVAIIAIRFLLTL